MLDGWDRLTPGSRGCAGAARDPGADGEVRGHLGDAVAGGGGNAQQLAVGRVDQLGADGDDGGGARRGERVGDGGALAELRNSSG